MSFRELRSLTEIMRALGYPGVVYMDDLCNPNFELVADMLYWMTNKYDPDIRTSDNIENENDRVGFLNATAQALYSQAHLKLNTKHLYAANGFAAKELLKLATVLYKAQRATEDITPDKNGVDFTILPTPRVLNTNKASQLAMEIAECGSHLQNLLDGEETVHNQRNKTVNFLDTVLLNSSIPERQYIEKSLCEVNERIRDDIDNLNGQSKDFEADSKATLHRVKKTQAELVRQQKRYKALQNHRPAFSSELEKLETDLQLYHETYLDRLRSRSYLEDELHRYRQVEQKEMKEHECQRNRNAERARKDELKQFIGHEASSNAAVEEELARRIGRFNVNGSVRHEDSHPYPSGTGWKPGYQVKSNLEAESGRAEERSHRDDLIYVAASSIEDEISLNDSTARSLTIDDEGSQARSRRSSCSGSDAF